MTSTPAPLTQLPAWKALEAHYQQVRELHLRKLFGDDPGRGERMTAEAVGLYLDYSKNRLTDETLKLLLRLAEASGLRARIDAMFRRGWVAETEQLLKRGLAQNQTAMQALGYRQIVEHLRGIRSLPETMQLVKIRTRQFAKRQMTWFRRQLHLTWVNLEPQGSAEAVARTIAEL